MLFRSNVGFRRIFCRCSSTIVGIAESKLRVCGMLGKLAAMLAAKRAELAELVELRFGQAAVRVGMCSVDRCFVQQRVLGL